MGRVDIIAALESLALKQNAAPAEVFRDFNRLLRTNGLDISENISLVLDKFHPATRVGRILRIRLVDRYHHWSEVVKLLQTGDSLDTNQTLKCRWFFTELENPENFVNQVLPTLSHSVRLKVINRYSSYLKHTASGEALYLSLKLRYGIRDAVLVLPACSESFIRDELPNLHGVILRPHLIMAIQKKYPSLATEYLAYLVDEKATHNVRTSHRRCSMVYFDYMPLFQKLSQTDLPAFIDIYGNHGKYVPRMTLGRRPMKNLVRSHFNLVLTKFDTCMDIFKGSNLFYRQLSYEKMKQMYICMLPPSVTQFFLLSSWNAPVWVLEDHVKPEVQSALLEQAFQSKYGKDPFSSDYLSKFGDHWLGFLPTEHRIIKVEERLSKVHNAREQSLFLAYLPLDQSIPRMKKLMEAQSDPEVRYSIAVNMVKAVQRNKNPEEFRELFSYFNKRYRNETKQFRERILSELCNDGKFLLQLAKDDWAPIDELIDIVKINKEDSDESWLITTIMKSQIHCYFLRKIDVEPYLQKYLDFQISSKPYFDEHALVLCENTPYQVVCVEWFLKKIPTIEWKSNSNKLSAVNRILMLVNEVNLKNKPGVNLHEEFIVLMEDLMKDQELYHNREFRCLLKHARHVPRLRDRLMKVAFPGYMSEGVLSRFLRIDPELVHDKLDNILSVTFEQNFHKYRLFYSKCRLYEAYGIPQKLARLCRVSMKLEKEESVEDGSPLLGMSSRPHAVQVLSLVSQPTEYAELISSYTPAEGTIREYSTEAAEMFTLQKAICRSFVSVSKPKAVLPVLWKFTVDDYLKIAVGSLNGVCSRVPEHEILPVLKNWTDCPVSLRKHILRLIFRVAPAEQSMTEFVDSFKKEHNSSIRYVIFSEIRKTFIAEPNDHTFNVLCTVINLLTEKDESLNDLICVESISSAYVSQYLELIWNQINSNWKSVLPNGKESLIKCIDKQVIQTLENRFCAELLSHDLKNLPDPLSNFCYLCIMYAPSWECQLARFKQIVSALTPFVQNRWNERETQPGHVFKVRRTVGEFVHKLCEESRACEDSHRASRILNETKSALAGLTELRSSLELFYWLDAHILFLGVQNEPNTSFETALAELYKTYIEKHGSLVPHSLVMALSTVVPMVSSATKLAFELAQNSELPLSQILATKIVEKTIRTEEELPLYNSIIEKISSSENPDVQAAASAFLAAVQSILII